jgi:hypothetical protein
VDSEYSMSPLLDANIMRAFRTIHARLLLVFMSVLCGVLKLLGCRLMSCTSI